MTEVLSAFTCYRDPDAAVRWLERVLGFEVVSAYRDEASGRLEHAELRRGEAVVMVQHDAQGYDVPAVKGGSVGHGLYLAVGEDAAVDELHRRAVEAGAHVLAGPATTEWGNHHVELLDPEGRQWSVGAYVPGRAAW
ncbi:glyoxalase [Kineococcus sp. T13]|uniref:VOC family protein n=1 Tax=Kineococcus vitellinus TaxID=2696565 RepID=UPI001412D53E|nr:VOC family protein [Kineococcus vitellinus]NAZ74152.1 glyoxalase [Kineococcus vitellinus]